MCQIKVDIWYLSMFTTWKSNEEARKLLDTTLKVRGEGGWATKGTAEGEEVDFYIETPR